MTLILVDLLTGWDQKDTGFLKQIYRRSGKDPDFLQQLAKACSSPGQQPAATWLIKHHLERTEGTLDGDTTRLLLDSLPELQSWAAQLHILQVLDRLILPVSSKDRLVGFIEKSGLADKAMVRAWAFYGLAVLGDRFPDLKDRAKERLSQAKDVETAGSIKVRLRKGLALLAR